MNTIVELHDSRVVGILKRQSTVVVHFQPAYLHLSEGRPGIDPGTGSVQEALLTFREGSVEGEFPEFPCNVQDGEFIWSQERLAGFIPVPFEVKGLAELHLIFDAVHTVSVKGQGVRLELVGEPRFVEDVKD